MIENIIKEEIRDFLNEESINYINIDDVLDKKFVDEMINEYGDDYVYYFRQTYDLDNDIDDNDIKKSNEFGEYLKANFLEENYSNAYYEIEHRIQNGILPIYRAMTVDENWLNHLEKQGKHLGIYWSWDESGAEAHWGGVQKNLAIIESEVNEEYVNWIETLQLNSHLSLSDEKEIRLYKNTPLKIIRLTINDEEMDISSIQDKIFYA